MGGGSGKVIAFGPGAGDPDEPLGESQQLAEVVKAKIDPVARKGDNLYRKLVALEDCKSLASVLVIAFFQEVWFSLSFMY